MTGRCKTIVLVVLIISLAGLPAGVAASTPTEAVQTTVDAVLDTLRDKDLAVPEKRQERRDRIRALIQKRFDFEEMSKRSLARHWKKRSPEEKSQFVGIFSELLEASYIGRIESYTNEKIAYGKEVIKGGGKYGVVSTKIMTSDVDIPIDYKLLSREDQWFVYDVVVEGVSFISTYRSQYDKIIVRESFPKLIDRMKSKLKDLDADEGKQASSAN